MPYQQKVNGGRWSQSLCAEYLNTELFPLSLSNISLQLLDFLIRFSAPTLLLCVGVSICKTLLLTPAVRSG